MLDASFLADKLVQFGSTHSKFLIGIAVNIVLIYFVSKIIDLINKRVLMRLRAKVSEYPMLTIVPISLRALKIVIACLLIAGFLQSFGYNVSSVIAGLGIVGLAVGFAAQTTIGNVFGSFSLLIDKVYKIGDYIQFGEQKGYVENINLRSTTLRTAEGFMVNVPNNILANMAITNVSQTAKYKIDFKISIECDTPVEIVKKAVAIMQDVADREELVEDTALAYIESLEDTAINLRLICYTKSTKWKEYMCLRSNMLCAILDSFHKSDIKLDIPDSRIMIEDIKKVL